MSTFEALSKSVINGESLLVEDNIQKALSEGYSAADIIGKALIPAMDEVGARYERQEFFLPEMVVAAESMKVGLAILKPLLSESDIQFVGKVVIGTVQGDMHDIGKNLVATMLEGAGFEVIDLGTNVKPETFVAAAQDYNADIVGMSALLSTTLNSMKLTIDALDIAGTRSQIKIMVGGAPVNDVFAESIGADGYAQDASKAVVLARSLI